MKRNIVWFVVLLIGFYFLAMLVDNKCLGISFNEVILYKQIIHKLMYVFAWPIAWVLSTLS